jgi:hypothetical protein
MLLLAAGCCVLQALTSYIASSYGGKEDAALMSKVLFPLRVLGNVAGVDDEVRPPFGQLKSPDQFAYLTCQRQMQAGMQQALMMSCGTRSSGGWRQSSQQPGSHAGRHAKGLLVR